MGATGKMEIRKKLHWIKNLWLRARYGAGCCDTYTLHFFMAGRILRWLKAFRATHRSSHPADLSSLEEWDKELEKMIWSFEYLANGENSTLEQSEKDAKREQAGFELFGRRFRDLWW